MAVAEAAAATVAALAAAANRSVAIVQCAWKKGMVNGDGGSSIAKALERVRAREREREKG